MNDLIEVIALFSKDRLISIKKLRWQKRVFEIDSVNFIHTSREGGQELIHFSVNSKNQTFGIIFNKTKLTWHLMEVMYAK